MILLVNEVPRQEKTKEGVYKEEMGGDFRRSESTTMTLKSL